MNREIGEKSRAWKGMLAGYVAKHMWIVKHYGKAKSCENPNCKSVSPKRFEWANISGNYLRERSDYMQMCPSCHRKMDIGSHCRKGHEFTDENTSITKQGWRRCKTCFNESQKKYRSKKKSYEK